MLKQKFRRGNLVHIINGSCQIHFEQGCNAIILGSYDDFYGGGDIHKYQVMFQDGSTSAWYEERQLYFIEEGGEQVIQKIKEDQIERDAKNILLNKPLDDLYMDEIITLLRFIGFDYSIGNDYFSFWKRVLPVFQEIEKTESPDLLKEQYPEYDIEGVWNIFHRMEAE